MKNCINVSATPEKVRVEPDDDYRLGNLKFTLRSYRHLFGEPRSIRIYGTFYTAHDSIDPVFAYTGVKVSSSVDEILKSRKYLHINVDGEICPVNFNEQVENITSVVIEG